MKYGAVIFDLYGTLVPSISPEAYDASVRETAEAAGADPQRFCREWVDEGTAYGRATGVFATKAACIEDICRRLGVSPGDGVIARAAEVRLDAVRRWMQPRPDAVATLTRLRGLGLKLGMMSVCSADAPLVWPETPFAPLFDVALFSCREGLTKPDGRFYRRACERLSVQPDQCLYVGDGACDELSGAENVGMTAVLICPPQEEAIILARQQVRNWRGARVAALSEVPALLDGPAERRP
jgi:putative hydrolase of the HAD superfamily